MLQTIHDKSKGWFAYLIVGFISIPFLLWGVNEYLGGGDTLVVAKVNGDDISLQEYQRALQQQRERLREMLGGAVPEEMLGGDALKQGVVQGLIREKLMGQLASDQHLEVSNAQLANEIKAIDAFHVDGRFSKERYEQLLQSQRMSVAEFEASMRQGLVLGQLENVVRNSELLTPADAALFEQLKGQKRIATVAVVKSSAYLEEVSLSDDEIKSFYNTNQDRFKTDEQVRVSYVILDPAVVEASVSVSEDAVRAAYDQDAARFMTPASRRVSHILVKPAENESDEALLARVNVLKSRIESGERFSDIAKAESADANSAAKGGDLGVIYPGDFDEAFEKTAFALDKDVVSAPFKTAQGFQLILVTAINESQQKSFEDARESIETELKKREADRLLLSKSEQLMTLSYENPSSLDGAADAIGAKVEASDWFTRRSGDGVASDSKVRELAFSSAVLTEKKNSDVIDLPDGRQVVIRTAEHKPAQVRGLEEVRDEVVNQLKVNKSRAEAKAQGETLKAKAIESGNLAEIAQSLGADTKVDVTITRDLTDVAADIIDFTFKMSRPEGALRTVDGFAQNTGDYVVVSLGSVENRKDLTPESALAGTASQLIRGGYSQRSFEAVYRQMESGAEIEIFESNL